MTTSSNIDLYSGSAELSIDLINLPGRNGLDLEVAIHYSSRVYDAATTDNLTEPTGVLGLGWTLPYQGILALRGSNLSDVSYYMVGGAASGPLVCTGTDPSGAMLFELVNYRFWKIAYQPAGKLWRVIHEDGNVWIYGDQNSSRGTVQWGISWGNWRGASNEQTGQTPFPIAFNLSQITNRFGDTITWEYDNVLSTVGAQTSGAIYTQASYPKKITGVTGESVVFAYQEKINDLQVQEFVIPHTSPAAPNAYQDNFQTRYLDSLTAHAADGSLLFTQRMSYLDTSGQTAFLGTGNLAKRLLTKVVQTYADAGPHLPGPLFSYCGQSSDDAVSAAAPFNATTQCLYGALKTMTTMSGGTITYRYGAVTPSLSQKSAAVAPPEDGAVTFTQPRFHFSDAYVVATWLDSDNNLRVVTYVWDSRWLAPNPAPGLDVLPLAAAAAYDAVPVACSRRLFAAFSENQVHLYQADFARAGMWIQPSVLHDGTTLNYFTTDFATGEAVRLVVGESFAAVLGLGSGKLFRYRATGGGWQSDEVVTLAAGAGANAFDAVARNNYLFALDTLQATGPNPLLANLYLLTEAGDWNPSTFSLSRQLSGVDSVTLFAGETFVVAMLTDAGLAITDVEYIVLWWSADGSQLSSTSLGVFSVPTGQVVQPSIKGSSLAIGQMLYRFDGADWNYQNISNEALQSSAFGEDVMLRVRQVSDSQYIYDLTQYDPNIGAWATALSAGESAAGSINQPAQGNPGASPYVVFDSKLYHRQPDATWQQTTATIPFISGDDALSLRLAGDRFLIYQQLGNTNVYPLKDGAALAQIPLTGTSIYTPATNLVGSTSFIGYTADFGGANSTLTLFRVDDYAVSGASDAYVVTAHLDNNGYQTVTVGYVYDAATAISAAARSLRSNKTTSVPGGTDSQLASNGWSDAYYFNGLTPQEPPALPYPADPNYTNAPGLYSLVAGSLYNARAFPSGAEPNSFVAENEDYVWAYARQLGQLATGYYLRTLKTSSTVDGVSTSATATFSLDTGLVSLTTTFNFNSSGQAEQIISEYKYFWEIYDSQRALNLLTSVIQTTMRTVVGQTSTTTGIFVTTYREDWGGGAGQWAPERTYRALSGTAPAFNNWKSNQGDPVAGWLRTSTMLDLTAAGLPRRMANVDGTMTATLYDTDELMAVASFINADPDSGEASYYGFDPYEEPGGWGWSGSLKTIKDNITGDDHHTGVQCLKIAGTPGQKVGAVRKFQPTGQNRSFCFGVWIKTQSNFDPAQGAAAFEIAVYTADNTQTNIATLAIAITDTLNQWVYKQQIVNLPQLRQAAQLPPSTPLFLRISGWNQNSAAYILVDNMRFSPVDATFSATVYEPRTRLATAGVGNNGEVTRSVYDPYDRLVATVGPDERVNSLTAESYSRDLTTSDAFLPQFPNSTLALATTSKSIYYDFHDSSTSEWILNNAGGAWVITGGQLTFTGATNDPLGSTAALNVGAFTNFAMRIFSTAHSGAVGVGNGDAFVFWDAADASWKLVRRQLNSPPTLIASSTAVGFHPDLLYVIVDGLLVFYAGGVMVFAYDYQDPNTSLPNLGKPALLLTADGSFDDLVVLVDPQFSVAFHDGFRGHMQSVALIGRTSGSTYMMMTEGVFLDSLGRAYVSRNLAEPPLAIGAPPSNLPNEQNRELIESGQTTYLVNSAGQPVSLPDYLNGTFGFDYTKTQFEPSPLSRVTSVVLPRESGQSAANFTVTHEYGAATAELIQGILPTGTEQNYFLLTTIDQAGTKSFGIFDQTGKMIATRIQIAEHTYQTTAVIYDASGNVVTIKQPNFFTPPPNSQAGVWQEIQTFTFEGLLAARTTPDAGQIAYLYDNSGRLRFVANADGAALTPPQFVYAKYDALGRCLEEGYIQDAQITWAGLAAVVNDQTFPNLSTVTGAWLKRRNYDVDDQNNAANLLGRLWRVSINNSNAQNPDTEIFSYETTGNVSSVASSTPSVDTATYLSGYSYDNQGGVSVITYPHKSGETPLQVAYYYDRLGRPAAVGKPVDPGTVIDPANPATGNEDLYAGYAYDGTGALVQENLNNRRDGQTNYAFARQYNYNKPGWMTRIDDPFLTQNIDYYEQPGSNHTTYYSGVVSRAGFAFKPQPGFQPPADYGYSYAYDVLQRLLNATNTLTDAGSITVAEQGYDANNNLLQVVRGATTESYSYQESATSQTQKNNQVYNLTESATTAIDFGSTPVGWSWGASNGGPSTSSIVSHNGGSALQLGGGSLGHFEFLELNSYLAPEGVYNLSYLLMTPSDFASDAGIAGWYLIIVTAAGAAVTVSLGAVPDTGGAWQQASISSINVGQLLTSLAPGAEPVALILQLRNYRRPVSGTSSGAPISVTNVSLSTTANVAGGVYTYYPGGAVQAAPDRGITLITYDPVNLLTRQIQMGGNPSLAFSYDGSDARLLMTAGNLKRLYLRGPDASPLRVETSGDAQTTLYNIYGATGLLGVQDATGFFFVLKDNLGSARLLVSDTNQVAGGMDYQPFGESLRTYGSVNTDFLFTGQELDAQTGLYNFSARLYDPALRRFYAPDAAGPAGSPYTYCANNPVNLVDPDGNLPEWANDALAQAQQFYLDSPNLVIGATTAALVLPAAIRYRGQIGAAGLAAIGLARAGVGFARTGAVAVSNFIYQYWRPLAGSALTGYGAYVSPSITDFVIDTGINIAVSVASAQTVMRGLHLAEVNIPVRHAAFTWPLGLSVVMAEGIIKGRISSLVQGFFGRETTRAEIPFLKLENYQLDAFNNVAAHLLFNGVDFRTAISPRGTYGGERVDVFYLKFPQSWKRWFSGNIYKGITSGVESPASLTAIRHHHHDWNPRLFGPAFPVASTVRPLGLSNNQHGLAIKAIERLAVQWMGHGRALAAAGGNPVGWPQRLPDDPVNWAPFYEEFVYWHFRYGFTHLTTPVEAGINGTTAIINGVANWFQGG